MKKQEWTREELILAYNLYCKTPFTKINAKNKDVIELSQLIGRSVSAIALKLANFARLDPDLHKRNIVGMRHGSKAEEIIWKEFNTDWESSSFESEVLLCKRKNKELTDIFNEDEVPEGKEKMGYVKQRINQNFFREMVLASFDNKCCITGSGISCLLTACHIKPWNQDVQNRLNPRNGLCMNGLHHKAFDQGLFTITTNYKILISQDLYNYKDPLIEKLFIEYNGKEIKLPQRFFPDKEFLRYHNDAIFNK
jgi:putative restriction endonuclease